MTTSQSEHTRRPRRRRGAPSAGPTGSAEALEAAERTGDAVEDSSPWLPGRPPAGAGAAAAAGAAEVSVVVQVTESNYVPEGVDIRARISARMFTAQLPAAGLEQLQQDPRVVSVGFPRAVHPAGG